MREPGRETKDIAAMACAEAVGWSAVLKVAGKPELAYRRLFRLKQRPDAAVFCEAYIS